MAEGLTRAVVMTNRLAQWGGAEIITCELAEELAGRGMVVTVYAHFISDEIRAMLGSFGISTTTDPDAVEVMGADIAYSHHQIISLLLARQSRRDAGLRGEPPVVVYNHLSPYEPLETPGPFVEEELADHIWCNSPETQAMLAEYGPAFARAEVVPNPAPERFFASRPAAGERLASLLVVSNHVPQELTEAMGRLSAAGIRITHLGLSGVQRRIDPTDILGHDAVLTIGKTVQYALASRTPVYCYDHFGGPGWLDATTFPTAEATNFSGRSRPQRRTVEDLVHDITAGFPAARDWAAELEDSLLDRWRLSHHIDGLIEGATKLRADVGYRMRRQALLMRQDFRQGLKIEGNIQESLRAEVVTRIGLEHALRRSQQEVQRLRPVPRSYFSRLNRALRGKQC